MSTTRVQPTNMTVHLVNPSHLSFGVGVITPRWLFVLAGATPASHGDPRITDETLEPFDLATVQPGDVVGIGIHTGNALRGYEIGTAVRAKGRWSSTAASTPRSIPRKHRASAAPTLSSRVTATRFGPIVLDECGPRKAAAGLRGGPDRRRSVRAGPVGSAPSGPLHVGVRTDRPRLPQALLVLLGLAHRRPETPATRPSTRSSAKSSSSAWRGFRFVALADDNFYPVTLTDLADGRASGQCRPHRATARAPRPNGSS